MTSDRPQTPDYGEPWKMLSREVGDFTTHPTPHDVNNKQVCDPYRNGLVEDCQKRAERIIACVNACAGMADPAKEFEVMRNQLNALRWIPITERLPTIEDGDQFEDVEWSDGKGIWQGNYKDFRRHNTTHWRRITLP